MDPSQRISCGQRRILQAPALFLNEPLCFSLQKDPVLPQLGAESSPALGRHSGCSVTLQVRGHPGKTSYLVQHLPVELLGALAPLRRFHRVIEDVGVPVRLPCPDPSTFEEEPGVVVPLDEGVQLQVELADEFADEPGKKRAEP